MMSGTGSLVLCGLVALLALIMLFDIALLYRPYYRTIDTHARIQIDDQNLTSSLGNRRYEIPWQYFINCGTATESSDCFYLKSTLGKVYLPKRAFPEDGAVDRFRSELKELIGDRFCN